VEVTEWGLDEQLHKLGTVLLVSCPLFMSTHTSKAVVIAAVCRPTSPIHLD